MGILNLTPDSFYDGGKYNSEKKILLHTEKLLIEGVTFIDIGAYSSRPGAKHISEAEELSRLIPILETIIQHFPEILISIDTFRSEVAKQSIAIGACMINDISAGSLDKSMFETIAKLQVPYIIMHMQGTPQNMQHNPTYENVTEEVKRFFQNKLSQLHDLGVNDVILDVGFGFGKTLQQNYQLLKSLKEFIGLNKPILVGLSRKSMLYKPLEITPSDALNATSVAHTIAVLNGANILRVHDIKEAAEVLKICNQYNIS